LNRRYGNLTPKNSPVLPGSKFHYLGGKHDLARNISHGGWVCVLCDAFGYKAGMGR
jgi:hypothetical protein